MNESDKNLTLEFKKFKTLTVIGANWGDEGKGKVIDYIMEYFDVVARFSGGANAGHTVFTPDGKKVVSHLIPCGLAQNKICVMARGEFFNLELFLKELAEIKTILGENLAPIYIDRQAPLWTPYHSLFEIYIESFRGKNTIGTTNKGIGPLEAFNKLRIAPVVGYLFEPELLRKTVEDLYNIFLPCFELASFKALNIPVPKPEEVLNSLLAKAGEIKDMVIDASYFLESALGENKKIMLEGAQATGLDALWGTYPYVSSGNSAAFGAGLGTGLDLSSGNAKILVAKTLPSRVGNGPMPSEIWERQAVMDFTKNNPQLFVKGKEKDEFLSAKLIKINSKQSSNAEMAQYFQVLGDERGATTGRGRSLGFLDIPWLQYAVRINKPNWLALTRFDMLSGINNIPVVTGYKFNGELLPPGKIPAPWELPNVEIVTEDWPCFTENIFGIDEEKNLPQSAKDFILKLEKLLGVPILLVGTGPSRPAMIVRR